MSDPRHDPGMNPLFLDQVREIEATGGLSVAQRVFLVGLRRTISTGGSLTGRQAETLSRMHRERTRRRVRGRG